MFRKSLIEHTKVNNLYSIQMKWMQLFPWMIRVPFFDEDEPEYIYVNAYAEKLQQYVVTKISIDSGDQIWQTRLVNGGYGTPAIFNNVVVVLSGFDGVSFINKNSGEVCSEIRFGARIRSSINIAENKCWMSYGSHIVSMDSSGEIQDTYHIPNSFIYGTISLYRDLILCTGTQFISESNESHKFLWSVNRTTGTIHYAVDLGSGRIISADTSGAWIEGNRVLVSNANKIYCINADTGIIEWISFVGGDVHRHVIVSDKSSVFYTTLSGNYGSLTLADGMKRWERGTHENIESPPAILGGSLLICSDASLFLASKEDGIIYQSQALGHVPYSAPTIWHERVYVGGGEPPSQGVLMALECIEGIAVKPRVVKIIQQNDSIDDTEMLVAIDLANAADTCTLHVDLISSVKDILGNKVGNTRFVFLIPLKPLNIEGMYAIPITIYQSNIVFQDMITISLLRKRALPISVKLSRYDYEVKETMPLNSGAAIAKLIFSEYGKKITQDDFRSIIDYLKSECGWEDADFQTWRLILKRALSSPATNLDEFRYFERLGEEALGESHGQVST